MKIDLEYNIDDIVSIKPLNLEGRVTGVTITRDGVEIKCKYYSSGDSKYDWFYEDELEHVREKNVGFVE